MQDIDSEKLLAEFWRRVEAKEIVCREVQGRLMVTTPEIVSEEAFILDWAKQYAPALAPRRTVTDSKLNAEQRQAVEHVLTTTSRVQGIIGRAGTGKTTLMTATIAAIHSQGGQVIVMTPHSEHAYQRLRQDGFKDAVTVEAFLRKQTLREECTNATLWIDEAGLLSNQSMRRLFEVADEMNARIVLAGDPRQHGPVDRGLPFKLLSEAGDVPFATLKEIQRQRGHNREIVEHLASGDAATGFKMLEASGNIHERNDEKRYQAIAKEYVQAVDAGKAVLLISPTHDEGRKVTDAIRRRMKAAGKLGQERAVPVLRKLNWSKAERADCRSYYPGIILELTHGIGGYERGERLEVVNAGKDSVAVRDTSGALGAFNVADLAGRFQTFERDELRVGLGEIIRITKNGRTLEGRRLNNGSIHTVTDFTPYGELKTKLGTIPRGYMHLAHGWVSTSFASQGRTVQNVIIAQSSASGRASNARQFYVSVPRERESIKVFTDNRAKLLESLQAEEEGMAAVELMAGKKWTPLPLNHAKELQRA